MIIIGTKKVGCPQDPTRNFNFRRFSKQAGDFVLVEAGFGFKEEFRWNQYNFSKKRLNEILGKKIVRLDFEEPNKFTIGDNPDEYDGDFYKVFTLCPDSADWLNNRQNTKKHIPIFFPFNEEYIPAKSVKKFDIIYTGSISTSFYSKPVFNDIKTISKFDFRVVSNSDIPLVTNKSASYKKKLRLISQSRITLVHNLLYLNPRQVYNVWKFHDWQKNKAFRYIPKWYQPWRLFSYIQAPQLKSRLFEAAFCRSLILCKRDHFNIVEKYFKVDKEFIYFKDGELEEKIIHILKNYKDYKKIINNAYERAINNYTTKIFFEKYLKDIA